MSFGGGINTFQQYTDDFGIGNNGVKISLNYFDGFPEPSLLNSLANNELKLLFKSLMKRDDTTKEKALNDLTKLVVQEKPDLLQFDDIFLICWSQLYAKLTVNELKAIRFQAHLITITLIKLLNKKISKFLKDFIPLILLGTCECDSYVSKNCTSELQKCFNNDEKKINALWSVFYDQILNLVREVIVVEEKDNLSDERYVSKEESDFKYNRVLTSSVNLLIFLLGVENNDGSNNINDEKYSETFHSILSNESFWKSFNLKSPHQVKLFEMILELMAVLYGIGYLKHNKDILKTSVRRLFKAITEVNSKNIMSFKIVIPSIINVFSILNSYKNGRIWSYDKNAKDKLMKLFLTSNNDVSPGYFPALYALYQKTLNQDLLDYEIDWLPVWQKSLKYLNEKPIIGRYGKQILAEFWMNFLKFLGDSSSKGIHAMIETDIMNTLNSGIILKENPDLTKVFASHATCTTLLDNIKLGCTEIEKNKNSKKYLNNLITLLVEVPQNTETMTSLAHWIFEVISLDSLEVLQKRPELLQIYSMLIKSDKEYLKDEIAQFIYEIPMWLDQATYDLLSNIFVLYTNSIFIHMNDQWKSCVEDFFIAASSIRILNEKLIYTLNQMNNEVLVEFLNSSNSMEVKAFITSYIETYKYEDNAMLLKGPLIQKCNISILYSSAKVNDKLDPFCDNFPVLSKEIQVTLIEETDFIYTILESGTSEAIESLFKLILPLAKSNGKISKKIANEIINFSYNRKSISTNRILVNIASQLVSLDIETLELFIPSNLEENLMKCVLLIDYRNALTNSFGLNMHLMSTDPFEIDMSKIRRLIFHALFLDEFLIKCPEYLDAHILTFLSQVLELATDYNYLSTEPEENFFDIKHTLYKDEYMTNSFDEIVQKLTSSEENQEDKDSITLLIPNGSSFVFDYYRSRVLYRILSNCSDSLSKSSIVDMVPKVERFVTETVRSRELKEEKYLIAGIILSTFKKINTDSSTSKIRTLLSSECIGSRPNELSTTTYRKVLLLNDTLAFEADSNVDETFMPIASQRLNMLLNDINKWLDSEISYDTEFNVMRISLLRCFSLLLKFPAIRDFGEIVTTISQRLLVDTLSMCQIEDTSYLFELRSQCLTLYESMTSHNIISDEGVLEEVNENMIELALITHPAEISNQISTDFYSILNKLLLRINSKYFSSHFNRIYELYLKNIENVNINRTRILFNILEVLIYERQQEAVVELELEQQKLHTNGSNDNSDIDDEEDQTEQTYSHYKLPAQLLDNLLQRVPTDYLEYENESSFIKYLWDWSITLRYFDDVSYKMRQLFIEQLKVDDLINKMYDFISDQTDLTDFDFWRSVTTEDIRKYDSNGTQFSTNRGEIIIECRKLLVSLFYQLFNDVGSMTSTWFLNIKDRSRQMEIEKFVSEFISPILISDELNQIEAKMDRLVSKDNDLSIKINNITNEVRASYLIDEQKLEITFKLPSNYPLTNVRVIGTSRVGISEQKWKQWIMSTQHVITGMNGSVLDSLELFTKNVNLQFSGFEECAICYSILHAVDRKLPNKTCPTCKNKFHGACLYKWFRSSGNNTCPLCRTEIPFRR